MHLWDHCYFRHAYYKCTSLPAASPPATPAQPPSAPPSAAPEPEPQTKQEELLEFEVTAEEEAGGYNVPECHHSNEN